MADGRVLTNHKRVFSKLTLGTKQSAPSARAHKTVPENGVLPWVPWCLRSQVRFKRCDELYEIL